MPKTFPAIKPARIPPAVVGIQANFCKNPVCRNFGVPAKERPKGSTAGDGYHSVKGGSGVPVLSCRRCGEYPSIKSNLAISEERRRMLAYLDPPVEVSCPNTRCANHGVPVSTGKAHYQSFGQTPIGSRRYRCKGCGRTFTVSAKSTARQRQAHKNRMIFSLLMNKSPFRRICEVADIHPETLYQRIDFFYRQCQAFAASREKALLDGMPIPRLYVAVDRQEYVVNWSNQADKRNVVLHAVGSADHDTGYVFGMHLDFDPTVDGPTVERDATARGDQTISYPFRRFARLWLKADYTDLVRLTKRARKRKIPVGGGVTADVTIVYDDLKDRLDVESPPTQSFDTKLPSKGMQVHSEYTLYGHFFFLKRLFGGVEKVRFFLDQESGIRAACLAAFCEEAKARRTSRRSPAFS